MNFKNSKIKSYFLLATYVIILAYVFFNISTVVSFLKVIFSAFAPVLIGIAMAFVLNIPLKFFEKLFFEKVKSEKILKLKRPLSLLFTLMFVTGIFICFFWFIIPMLSDSISSLGSKMPDALESFREFIMAKISSFNIPQEIFNKIFSAWNEILQFLTKSVGFVGSQIIDVTLGITSTIVTFFLSLVISIYMLFSKESLIFGLKKVIYAFFKENIVKKIFFVGNISNNIFSSFIAGQCTEALIIATLCFIGLFLLKFPYALLISVIIGVTSLIPIIGAFLGVVPGILILLIIDPMKAVWFVVFIIVLQQIEGHLIYPKVVGGSVGLSSLWVIIAMTIGGSLFGFLGMLFSIPVFSILYTLLSLTTNKRLKLKNIQEINIKNPPKDNLEELIK